MVTFDVVPARMALVNVDMQNCFVSVADQGHAVLERVNYLSSVCRRSGIVVAHTRHVLRRDGSDAGLLGLFVRGIRDGMLHEDAESAAFHPGLVVDHGDIVLDKPRFGAFYGTNLEQILDEHEIDSIIISGISTDVCCDTTAREAQARDLKVFFLSDGTATTGPDSAEVQRRTLTFVGALLGEVLTTAEMAERIIEARP